MKRTLAITAIISQSLWAPALAQDHSGHGAHGAEAGKAGTEQVIPPTAGEVRRIDKETRKITIRHAPIANLGMPAMTMVFEVSDPALLNSVKVGDKVQFTADKRHDGALVVTRITPER
jgi:Cu(I)/Ag(I) efflux system protein CusF